MSSSEMRLILGQDSRNEGFSRAVVSAFLTRLDPTMEELEDIKTAVSEAVSNAIVHAYPYGDGEIELRVRYHGNEVTVEIRDQGIGIEDVDKARQALFTTRADEDRCGMGFYFMEAFMDQVEVESAPGKGTCVRMMKHLGRR